MAIDKNGAWYKKIEADLKDTDPASFDLKMEQDLKVSAFHDHHSSDWRTGMESHPGLPNGWLVRRMADESVTTAVVGKWRKQGVDHIGFSSMPAEDILSKCAELGMSVDLPGQTDSSVKEGWSNQPNQILDDVVDYSGWRPLLASSLPYQEKGVNKSTELALVLGWAHEQLNGLMESGKSIDEASAMVMLEMNVGPRILSEVSALRALRSMWSTVVEAYGPEAGCSRNCKVNAVCSDHTFTTRQPYTNLLRETASAMAAALGGADAITLPAFGEGGKVDKARISTNIQLLLKNESYLELVADPVGGSHALEEMTAAWVQKAWAIFQMFESHGGVKVFLESPEGASWLEEQHQQYADSLKDINLIGTTDFVWTDEPDVSEPRYRAEGLIAQELTHG